MNASLSKTTATLFAELRPDPWRLEAGFSADVSAANSILYKPLVTESEVIETIGAWLQRYQPCLFGRIGAKLGLISYCVLSEADLKGSDDALRNKIQEARTRWTREGFEGRKSAFIVIVVSPKISYALPNQTMKELARKVCTLYLLEPIEDDEIYMDEVFLENPGRNRTTWRWQAGVNYFCAQGDMRWWQDHRVPGGMAFSVNSVGHMAKASRLALAMKDLNAALDVPLEDEKVSRIDSLPTALEFAMRTIAMASEAISGKATELLPLPALGELPVRTCPVDLPGFLRDKNFCNYSGYYHTDYTVPSEYFMPDIKRPELARPHTLDFTYLFVNEPDNPDFITMGSGRRVRRADSSADPITAGDEVAKAKKAVPDEAPIEKYKRLSRALGL